MKPTMIFGALGASMLALAACSPDPVAEQAKETSANEMATNDGMTAGEGNAMVGGAEMFADRDIVANASNSPIHTMLVAAVKQAGLVETLSGDGPFTVFAPTDAAFETLPDGAVDDLMQPGQRETLASVLTYHVVPGRLTAADLSEQIEEAGGSTRLTTVQGETLTATMDGDTILLAGMDGSEARVTQGDVMQSNGVIHVVDGVVLPSM